MRKTNNRTIIYTVAIISGLLVITIAFWLWRSGTNEEEIAQEQRRRSKIIIMNEAKEQANDQEGEVQGSTTEADNFIIEPTDFFGVFEAENDFKTVQFTKATFQVPEGWLVSQSGTSGFNLWQYLVPPTGGKQKIILKDFDESGSLAYTNCGYWQYRDPVTYDFCTTGAIANGLFYVFASTILTAEETAGNFEEIAGALKRNVVIYGNDYLEIEYVANPGEDNHTEVFDYILETLEIVE